MTGTAGRLLAMLRSHSALMVASMACRVANQGLGVAIPALAAAGVVRVAAGAPVGTLVAWLALLAVVKGSFRYLEQLSGHAIAFRLLAQLRTDTYRRIVPLAPAGLDDARSGDLVARVVGDVDRVEPFYAHTLAPLASAALVPLLTAAGLAVWVDRLVAVAFLPFPLLIVALVPWVARRRVASLSAEARALAGEAGAVFTDAVQGAEEIAVLRARPVVAARIAAATARHGAVRRELARAAAGRVLGGELLSAAAVVAVTLTAIDRFGDGALGLAALAGAVAAAWVGTAPARALEDVVPDLEQALAAAGRLFALADRAPPVAPVAGEGRPLESGRVEFRGVGVDLAGEPTLAGVDLDIADGAYVAVVGPSGAGKSTLVELLLRWRDPDRGAVEIDGADVSGIPDHHLRSAVALVPQRPDLFHGTLADNLRLAAPAAADRELWDALDRAALGGWVRSLPRGLDTHVGELGGTMSGGQRQRLSIARALLRDPRVLVLDEATSELDAAAEQEVLAAVAGEAGGRTVIVVAHRIDTVVGADRIVVLDRGRVAEAGAHHELLAAGGVYAGLWRRHEDVLA